MLANEQVIDGRGWRSGALVEQRDLTQWFFKITSMSQDLLDSLETLPKWPEKVKLMQANWIGRSEGLLIRWEIADPSSAGAAELEVYTTRPDTIFGASFMAIAADHPLAKKAAEKQSRARRLHRRDPPRRHVGRGDRDRREEGFRHRHSRRPSVRPGLDAAGLCRELRADGLRHGRHLRLPVGRPARPRLRQQIRPAGHPGRHARGRGRQDLPHPRRGLCRRWRDDQFALPRRHEAGTGVRRGRHAPVRRRRRQPAAGRAQGAVPAARLADLAPALLGLPDPGHPLRRLRRGAGAGSRAAGRTADRRQLRQAGQSARPSSDMEACRLARNAASRRGATPTRWTRSSIRPGISPASPTRGTNRRRRRSRPSTAQKAGCRSTSISAASSTRSCICSIRASSPAP